MEIITAPPIPLCTFYCPFSNRKTAAEKNEGDKLYGGEGKRERELFLPSSEHSPSLPCFLRLTANFSSLFRSDGTQESTLRRRRRQTNLAERDTRTDGRGRTKVLRKTGETHKGYEGENATKADENSPCFRFLHRENNFCNVPTESG